MIECQTFTIASVAQLLQNQNLICFANKFLRMSEENSNEWQEFEQREVLATRIRNILREYPPGVGPYKEFLQNADDAHARCFTVLLDDNSYPSESVITPQLANFQVP